MKSIQDMTNELIQTGLSEQGLADLVGTSQPTIHRIRRGRTKNPGYELGRAIEKVYRLFPPAARVSDLAKARQTAYGEQ